MIETMEHIVIDTSIYKGKKFDYNHNCLYFSVAIIF